jgi:hypothetical protein
MPRSTKILYSMKARSTMKTIATGLTLIALSMTLLGCGGGGGGGDGGTTAVALPPVTGATTATLSDSQQTANDLVAVTKAAASNAAAVNGFTTLPLNAGSVATVASGNGRVGALALEKSRTVNCSLGGTAVIKSTYASAAAPSVGDAFQFNFASCSETAGVAASGLVTATVARWVSDQSFAFSYAVTNLSIAENGSSTGPYSFNGNYDYANQISSWSYTVKGQTVVGDPAIIKSGTTTTVSAGTVRTPVGAGFAEVVFTGWVFNASTGQASAGTANIAGASGQRAKITVGSAGYVVELTIGTRKSSYVVPF